MKRFALFLVCLLLTGCGDAKAPPVEEAPPAESPQEESVTPPSEGASADFSSQLALIAAQADQWQLKDCPAWQFAVTDLDQNGRLEVVTTVTQGTGSFTTTAVWEVSEDLDDLLLCTAEAPDAPAIVPRGDGTETGYLPLPVYQDETENTFHYITESTAKDSPASYRDSTSALTLRDGSVSAQLICARNTLYLPGEDPSAEPEEQISYEDGEGAAITEEAYASAVEELFAACTPMEARIGWALVLPDQAMEGLDAQLSASWDGFSLTAI